MGYVVAKLYFYFGTMNAGKTTHLLQADYNYTERGMKTICLTSEIDNRYKVGEITSRVGIKKKAVTYSYKFDFLKYMKNYHVDCVLVDESHFLTKEQVVQLAQIVDLYDTPVLTYGLKTDFKNELFEGSHSLLCWSDHCIELKSLCWCGSKAIMNKRIKSISGAQIEIGGNEQYVALCRKHFVSNKISY